MKTAWKDFRETFPDIGIDNDLRGHSLIKQILLWASRWPKAVKTQVVDDGFATASLLVFIKHDDPIMDNMPTVELVVIPQNANKPTRMQISRPLETIEILEYFLRGN